MTKSQTVMTIIMLTIVMYSVLLTRCRVSQSASLTRSMPRTKMSAPTIMTAIAQDQDGVCTGRIGTE